MVLFWFYMSYYFLLGYNMVIYWESMISRDTMNGHIGISMEKLRKNLCLGHLWKIWKTYVKSMGSRYPLVMTVTACELEAMASESAFSQSRWWLTIVFPPSKIIKRTIFHWCPLYDMVIFHSFLYFYQMVGTSTDRSSRSKLSKLTPSKDRGCIDGCRKTGMIFGFVWKHGTQTCHGSS